MDILRGRKQRIYLSFLSMLFLFLIEAGSKTITVTSNVSTGPGSLSAAIFSAINNDSIAFNLPVGSETIIISNQIEINKDITISGDNIAGSGTKLTISYADSCPSTQTSRVIKITGCKAFLHDLVIKKGRLTGRLPYNESLYGAGIYIRGSVVELTNICVSNCVMDSVGDYSGGAGIYNEGTLKLDSCNISLNSVKCAKHASGGGVFNDYGNLTITNSIITSNTVNCYNYIESNYLDGGCTAEGGGINNYNGMLIITNSIISSNSVIGTSSNNAADLASCYTKGGGIHNASGSCIISASTVSSNKLTATIAHGWDGCSAYAKGGGIFCEYGRLLIKNSTICQNTASSSATAYGGLFSSIARSTAIGGGISCESISEIVSCSIASNSLQAVGSQGSPYGSPNVTKSGFGLSASPGTVLLNCICAPSSDIDYVYNGDTVYLKAYNNIIGKISSKLTLNSSNIVNATALQLFNSSGAILDSNGGPTPTLAIPNISIAAGRGVRVGSYLKNDTIHFDAYWNGTQWRSLSLNDTVSGVTELLYDQRGVPIESPQCVGSFYKKANIGIVPHSVNLSNTRKISISNLQHGKYLLSTNHTDKKLSIDLYFMNGQKISNYSMENHLILNLSNCPNGLYCIRIRGLTNNNIFKLINSH